jgi:hypothetical protein
MNEKPRRTPPKQLLAIEFLARHNNDFGDQYAKVALAVQKELFLAGLMLREVDESLGSPGRPSLSLCMRVAEMIERRLDWTRNDPYPTEEE